MKKTLLCLAMAFCLTSAPAFSAPLLQKSGHYTFNKSANAWLEIDVDTFESNIARLQGKLSNNSKLCVVMKADAYGHGIDLLMPSIIKLNIPCIGITSTSEAKIAREHGYAGRILRLRLASTDEIEMAMPYEVEELVGNLVQAKAINELAKEQNRKIAVHIALNAGGMDRNGLDLTLDSGKASAIGVAKLPHLNTVGIMTHFANEDETYIQEKLAIFNQQAAWLIKHGKLKRDNITLHAANSFATVKVPESHLDMVRAGSLVYGDVAYIDPEQLPVMSFKSKVASVQFYPKGTSVGYDGTHTLMRDSYLANLPFGYSDGYRRVLSNKGVVLIAGERVPVVGKISMNTTMADITDLIENGKEVKIGDEVVIYGKQGDKAISQEELEDINGALLADLYTIWGNSNPKFIKSATRAEPKIEPKAEPKAEPVKTEPPKIEKPIVVKTDTNSDENLESVPNQSSDPTPPTDNAKQKEVEKVILMP